MKFEMKHFVLLTAIIGMFLVFSLASFAAQPARYVWREFSIDMPEEISANPGETITLEGKIWNTGWWWLHNFDLTVTGLPENYAYKIEPQHFDNVRIIWGWNQEQGRYKLPETFKLTIMVPDDAVGLSLLNVTGQELQSMRKVTNSSYTLLKITGTPEFEISDIVVPESVNANESFNVSFDVINKGKSSGYINISVNAPEDWKISDRIKQIALKSNSSTNVVIFVIPSTTSGQISLYAEYPYRKEIINITKVGKLLVPQTGEGPAMPTSMVAFVQWVKALPLWVIGIVLIVLVILLWKFYDMINKYKFKIVRKKPEKMVKPAEKVDSTNTNNISGSV